MMLTRLQTQVPHNSPLTQHRPTAHLAMASKCLSRNLPVQRSSVTESTESRWKRLRPDWYEGYGFEWVWPAHAEASTVVAQRGSRSRPITAAADQTIARCDELRVRHLRRGTTADALAALGEKGATALVDALHEDRYAKGATAANQSLLKTWQHFHDEAFGHVRPPLPLLPITVRILVMVGALFKAGGTGCIPITSRSCAPNTSKTVMNGASYCSTPPRGLTAL